MDQSQSTRTGIYELKAYVWVNQTHVTVELTAIGERLKTLRAFDKALAAIEATEEK